ncbi:hypothetical protein D906_00582 [Pseudomonas sp. LAIL14HWK12:I1]|nr:hypothetical protein D906_00582 [Pseudomonas sp. LAIL14HWK12:I1]SOC95637.1 hypothetical protein SAMN05660198_00586 [Pseudomonas sp. LAIL14HWK12:I3]
MAFLCRPAKGSKLIISDVLKEMLSHQSEALQLHTHDPINFGLMIGLQRFHSLGVQRMVGQEYLAQIFFHDLSLSPWLAHSLSCQHGANQAT